jgi:hypothetical protein
VQADNVKSRRRYEVEPVPTPDPTRIPRLALTVIVALVCLAGTGQAAVEGEVDVELHTLEEGALEAELTLTDAEADELRSRADRDDDGEVGSLEAAGAEQVLADRFEGSTDAYAIDGNPLDLQGAGVDADRLQGPVDRTEPVGLSLEADTRVSPGEAPHTFALEGTLTTVSGETRIAHTVRAPGGYAIGATEGFTAEDDCQARSPAGTDEASVTFEESEACSRDTPIGPWVALAGIAAAGLTRRRHEDP